MNGSNNTSAKWLKLKDEIRTYTTTTQSEICIAQQTLQQDICKDYAKNVEIIGIFHVVVLVFESIELRLNSKLKIYLLFMLHKNIKGRRDSNDIKVNIDSS